MNIEILGHLGIVFATIAVVWFFGGILVDSVGRISKKMNQSGFTTAFFILGFLTSLSEISVMLNSSISGTPQISAGNLSGASIMIFLCIIPFLAIAGKNGITMNNTLPKREFFFAIIAILIPQVLLIDGQMTLVEGLLCIGAYLGIFLMVRKTPQTIQDYVDHASGAIDIHYSWWKEFGKIMTGAVVIFFAGDILVAEAQFISTALSVPSSLVGLLLLSVGTNIPELIVAFRSILKQRTDIAFGGYIGSALTNTLSLGVLVILAGGFMVTVSQFIITAITAIIGLTLFYIFAQSKNNLSRTEGIILFSIYIAFITIQGLYLFGVLQY